MHVIASVWPFFHSYILNQLTIDLEPLHMRLWVGRNHSSKEFEGQGPNSKSGYANAVALTSIEGILFTSLIWNWCEVLLADYLRVTDGYRIHMVASIDKVSLFSIHEYYIEILGWLIC